MNIEEEIMKSESDIQLLTAQELVKLRSLNEGLPNLGVKYSACSGTSMEEEDLNSALATHKKVLTQERGSIICELIKAQWDEGLKAAVTTDLKGRFVQHMGHVINDKMALSFEESLFLLENGCIEIMNGKTPMSTEEAYNLMLKEHLNLEKYQVYSYLSQLGFIVVPHQKELNNKLPSKKSPDAEKKHRKRKPQSPLQEKSSSKRLTFSGILSESDVEKHSLSDSCTKRDIEPSTSQVQTSSMNETKSCEQRKENEAVLNFNPIQIQPLTSQEQTCSVNQTKSCEISEKEEIESVSNSNQVQTKSLTSQAQTCSVNETKSCEISEKEAIVTSNKSQIKPLTSEAESCAMNETKSCEISEKEEIKAVSNLDQTQIKLLTSEAETCSMNETKSCETSEKEEIEAVSSSNQTQILTKPSVVPTEEKCNVGNKESLPEECQLDDRRSESVNSLTRCDLEEMEVDSQSADITFEESREVRDSFDAGSNSLSQEIRIINSRKEGSEDNSEVICCSSSILNESYSEESSSSNVCNDDEVTLLEIKKKETTPLAVIDLLSDDEASDEELADEDLEGSDDDIKIIKVCNNPSTKDKTVEIPSSLEKIKSKKIRDCKVEASNRQSSVSSVQFPDIFRKDLVCVPRPPLNLLPLHVQPQKEVYILDLAKYAGQAEKSFRPPGRLWNSYKDMQDYQRSRRRNRHSDPYSQQFQSRDRRPWQKNFTHNNGTPRDQRQTFTQNDFNPRHLGNLNPWNVISSGNRLDVNNYDSHYSHSRQSNLLEGNNSRNGWRTSPLDQKPNSPMVFGNVYEQRNVSPYQNSQAPMGMHRTSYSYSASMFASMFSQPLNLNSLPHFRPFQPEGMLSPFGRQVNDLNLNSVDQYPTPSITPNDYFHNGRHNRDSSFPCHYRYVNNKTSWNDVRTVVRNENVSSSNNVGDDVEELPPDINEFLWNFSNISPLIKPGTKHAISNVLDPLRLTHAAHLMDKSSKHNRSLPDESTLEITYDVYLPSTNFKKSCPGTPNHRIIVVRAKDPIPRYSEIAVLQKQWNDGATLQIAVVDNADIAFCCFNNICLPSVTPFEE